MDESITKGTFKDFRRQRRRIYCPPGADSSSDESDRKVRRRQHSPNEPDPVDNDSDVFLPPFNVSASAEGASRTEEEGSSDSRAYPQVDISFSSGGSERADDGGEGSASIDIPGNAGTGAANVDDYLAGRNMNSVARAKIPHLANMKELERELVIIQTESQMSKTACERVFALLQCNADLISDEILGWSGTFRTARRHVLCDVPPCSITAVGDQPDGGGRVQLGPYSAFPRKEVQLLRVDVVYALFECRLVDVIAFHAHLHGTHENGDSVMEFDLALDGVPESISGGVSIDVLTVKFTHCRSVYTLAVLRPSRTGLQLCDSIILRKALDEYIDLQEGRKLAVIGVKLRYVICDAPKRAKLLAQKSHSGYSSCQHCEIHGRRLGNSVCFPPEPETALSPRRSVASVEAAAEDAIRFGMNDWKGIKGYSLLKRIPGYDYVTGVAQERMHLADLGVCRQICKLVFRCKGVKRQAGIDFRSVPTDGLSANMKTVKVPTEVPRRTRDFVYGNWKAQEYMYLYLAYWPLVAEQLLPGPREAWLRFVFIMRALTVREVGFLSEETVRDWQRLFARVFTEEACGYNIHAFTHILKLRELGLLSDTCASPYENHYGEMKRRFQSGTPSVGLQGIQDCCVRNLGTHACEKAIVISPKTTLKRDDSLVFTSRHGLLKVTKSLNKDEYEAVVTECEPTNFPLAGLDFCSVYAYRVRESGGRRRTVRISREDVIGKAIRVRNYVSMIPLEVLREA